MKEFIKTKNEPKIPAVLSRFFSVKTAGSFLSLLKYLETWGSYILINFPWKVGIGGFFKVHFTSVLHFALGFQNLANWNIEVAKAKEINQDLLLMAGNKIKNKNSSFSWEQTSWREKAQEIANLKTIKIRDYHQNWTFVNICVLNVRCCKFSLFFLRKFFLVFILLMKKIHNKRLIDSFLKLKTM
jgi:hypothetical protein